MSNPKIRKYLISSSLANMFCGFSSVQSTHCMLLASGVGDATAVASSISINFIGKDILGQIASIPFVLKFSKIAKENPQTHLRGSIFIFETANLIECTTPLFPHLFIPLAIAGNIGKNIGFIGTGSFNANIISKLSSDVISDYSLISVCNTISFSLGMSLGLLCSININSYGLRMSIMVILGIARYYALKNSAKLFD